MARNTDALQTPSPSVKLPLPYCEPRSLLRGTKPLTTLPLGEPALLKTRLTAKVVYRPSVYPHCLRILKIIRICLPPWLLLQHLVRRDYFKPENVPRKILPSGSPPPNLETKYLNVELEQRPLRTSEPPQTVPATPPEPLRLTTAQ